MRYILFFTILLFSSKAVSGQTYVEPEILSFDNGTTGITTSTPNLHNAATKIIGKGLLYENGFMIAFGQKTVLDGIVPFVGAVAPFAGVSENQIPTGWIVCDGRAIAKTDYPVLYTRIGDRFVSNPSPTSSTFNVPDLRDYFLRGADNMGTGSAGRDGGRLVTTTQNAGTFAHTHTTTITGVNTNRTQVSQLNTAAVTQSHSYGTQLDAGRFLPFPHGMDERESNNHYQGMSNLSNTTFTTGASTGDDHTHSLDTPDVTITSAGANGPGPKRLYLIYCIKATPH